MKVALITGITGQDGAYLAEYLLKLGYFVHGIKRRSSLINTNRIDHLYQDQHDKNVQLKLHYGDLTDSTNLIRIIQEVQPDEIYNLGAQSHVQVSFETPEYTANSDAIGTLRLLEAVKICNLINKTKIYQASTSEMYGLVQETPQTERTPFYPRSPYAVAKLYAYWITINYREAYGMFACNGILFNHESPLRGETFVTRKITMGVASICLGLTKKLYMGNLDALRDWGHAKDYIEAMHLMLLQSKPEDFVIATGKTTSVRDFIIMSFNEAGIQISFKGKGVKEKGIIEKIDLSKIKKIGIENFKLKKGDELISIDKKYFRPTEVNLLKGDATKAKEKLGWIPKYTLKDLIKEMVYADLELMKQKKYMAERMSYTINRFE